MNLDRLSLLFLVLPPVLWMMFNSYRSDGFNRFLINALGTAILVPAFILPGFILQESWKTAKVLTDALMSLSEADLRKYASRQKLRGDLSNG